MNPPLNCGAKIATKIESANFSVKKVHFSAKTARQGAFGAPERISFHDLTAPTGRRRTEPSTAGSGRKQPGPGESRPPAGTPEHAGTFHRPPHCHPPGAVARNRALPGAVGNSRDPESPAPPAGTPEHAEAFHRPPHCHPPGAGTRLLPLPHRPCDGPRHPPAGAAIPRPALALSTELSYL